MLKRVAATRGDAMRRAFQVLRRVSSPHLPAVLELIDERAGGGWLVTAWVDGSPLGPGPVPLETALAEARGVAHALASIHRLGTHHGDVSASNVLVTPTRGVVLTDLGQVGAYGCGTPGFLAPEALRGGGGPAADRFALGCLLCLRLFGHVPWRDPASLVRVKDEAAVRDRLRTLADAAETRLSPGLERLLVRLLHPDPARRLGDSEALARRLGELAGVGGGDSQCTWWLPSRWAYRGLDLRATVEALATAPSPRVVLVSGPTGSGRTRVVEELVQLLQERPRVDAGEGSSASSPVAEVSLCDAEDLAESLGGDARGWIDAWLAAAPGTFGVRGEPAWPAALESPSLRAALVRRGAALSAARLVMPVDEAVAARLPTDDPQVLVLRVRPWAVDEVEELLAGVLEEAHPREWAVALVEATEGWPARVVRSIQACAAEAIDRADADTLRRALARVGSRIDLVSAREVLERHWGVADTPEEGGVVRPGAWAVAAARNTLGDERKELGIAAAEYLRAAGRPLSIDLAIELDDLAELGSAVARASEGDEELPRSAVDWLESHRHRVDDPRVRAAVADQCLRWGDATRALAWASEDDGDAGVYLRARALLHLGRGDAALALVDRPRTDRQRGLRWRALVDQGRAGTAWAEAQAWQASRGDPRGGDDTGLAVALLWGGLAAMHEAADGAALWWDRALEALAGDERREARGLAARARQLQANLAERAGEGLTALAHYRAAARAFAAAGEQVGQVLADGSLSALAFQAGELTESLDRGRRAVRGMIALGRIDLLPAAWANLVQPLCLVDLLEEATHTRELVVDLCTETLADSPLSRARIERADAELLAAAFRRGGGGDRSRIELAMAAAARSLEAATSPREACDAWLQAASWARRATRPQPAAAHLDEARASLARGGASDLEVRLGVALEELAQAVDARTLAEGLRELARLPGPAALVEQGRSLAAWFYDRSLLAAMRRQYLPGHAVPLAVAQRQVRTLESIMSKTQPLDRDAARHSLLTEAGDAEPLRTLVQTLQQDVAALELAPASAAIAGGTIEGAESGRGGHLADAERLLRVFRRLGREDQLERLLEQLVEAMMDLTRAERGVVEIGSGDGRLEVAREFSSAGDGVRYSRSIIESVRRKGEPIISVDAAADGRFDESKSISHLNLRSVLAVPLVFRGEILGAAYVDHRLRRGAFDEGDLARMEDFCGLAALVIAHAQAVAGLRAQAGELETQRQELARLLETRDAEVRGLREVVRSQSPEPRSHRGIIGGSPAMQRVFRLVDRLADSDVPVVIHGESGTGKELIVRAIHEAGSRARRPFVAENCGAIPETLLESVLFGHARGAFTGASSAKPGLFEAADGGTIFLDEVGEMSAGMQTKLLRVLQEGEVRRIGENQARKVDVRVIAASNRDLEAMVAAGAFRQDLYYRIHVVRIDLPPLRDRREDIAPLVAHFLARHGGEHLDVSAAAMRLLTRYAWPGNVRELENETMRWIALVEQQVGVEDLAATIRRVDLECDDPDDLGLRSRVDRLERDLITRALERTGGNQTQAALLLGLSRFGLQKKLKRLGEVEP